MKILITGACGFLGSNLSKRTLDNGDELIAIDNLSKKGSSENLNWLESFGKFDFHKADIRESRVLEKILKENKPDVVFHLASQVSMMTSLENPRLDFETNVIGTFNLLEAIRKYSKNSILIYSSSNKVYGDLEDLAYIESNTRFSSLDYPNGFREDLPLDFTTPYGCSKGAAEQYILDYYKMYDIETVVFRHSAMYGGRQFSNFSQGWIGWFCQKAMEIKKGKSKKPFSISGSGKQVRDVLFADDICQLYFQAINKISICRGQAYNIGGGLENSLSLIELFVLLENEMDIRMNYIRQEQRKSDQKFFVADISKAKNQIEWFPKVSKFEGVKKNLDWISTIV